jgi:hypothetical protein
MPIDPNPALGSPTAAGPAPVVPAVTWRLKIARLAVSAFCMALGLVLLFVPWTDAWPRGYLPVFGSQWHSIWMNAYFRGAASGLGAADIYIAFRELFGFRKLTR